MEGVKTLLGWLKGLQLTSPSENIPTCSGTAYFVVFGETCISKREDDAIFNNIIGFELCKETSQVVNHLK